MVKGVSRRVVVVDAPDRRFEQAIFIVRDGAAGEGVSASALVEEARRAARDDAVPGRPRRVRYWLCALAGAALGASAVGLLWLHALLSV